MAQAGVKPTLRASRIKHGWWIVTVSPTQRYGFFSFAEALRWLNSWCRSQKLPVNG